MGCSASTPPPPQEWPPAVEVCRGAFENWSKEIKAGDVLIASPKTVDECVAICDWARAHQHKVRPSGTRYSWSPLTVDNNPNEPLKGTVLVDMTKYLNAVTSVDVANKNFTVQAGATFATVFERLAEDKLSLGSAVGTGKMCIGGAFAAGARGWACKPSAQHAAATEVPGTVYGTMTNSVLSLKAVVWDGETFAVREFTRSNPEDALVFIAVGRMLVVEYTVRAVDDYNMRMISVTDISPSTMFSPPNEDGSSKANSFADIVDRYGRISALFVPYTDFVWTRYSMYCPVRPDGSTGITGPYNYPFQDALQPWMNPFIKQVIGVPDESLLERLADAIEDPFTHGTRGFLGKVGAAWSNAVNEIRSITGLQAMGESLTPYWARLQSVAMEEGNKLANTQDLWGPSRWQLQYVNSEMNFSTWGISIAMRRDQMQFAAAMFFNTLQEQLTAFKSRGKFPVNLTVELRASGLDDGRDVGMATSLPLSPLFKDDKKPALDCAIIIDVVCLAGTKSFPEFAKAMMTQLREQLTDMRIMCEWSKPFAFSNGAPWDDEEELRNIRQSLPLWDAVRDRFAQLDPDEMFVDGFTKRIFTAQQ